MYYIKVTRDFIIELRNAWANYNKEIVSEVNRVANHVIEDIEAEADDDLRNERYNVESIYEWKREQISYLMEWKKESINEQYSIESDGNRLINTLSEMIIYDNKINHIFVFDFYKLEHYEEYNPDDLNGRICVRIDGVYHEDGYDDYNFRVDFNRPKVEYTGWLLED